MSKQETKVTRHTHIFEIASRKITLSKEVVSPRGCILRLRSLNVNKP